MTALTSTILNRYNWSAAEIETLETVGYEAIRAKVAALPEKLFNRVFDAFDAWLDGASKTPFTKARKAAGLTEVEVNIWMTV